MEEKIRHLVQAIHDSPGRVVIVIAGAGTQALAWLLGVAGASRTLLESLIPYDNASFIDFLDREPEQYVSDETAGLMAGRAVVRARHLCHHEQLVIGLACTATIATDRPKRGQHRANIVLWKANCVSRHSLVLDKGSRDRPGEEDLVSRLILNALSQAYGLPQQLPLPWLSGDSYQFQKVDLAQKAKHLHLGHIDHFTIRADGYLGDNQFHPKALLSGAFNPLHRGHLGLAEAAADILGNEVCFELTAVNADKRALTQAEILSRLLQFAGRYSVVASNAPTFVAKARLFPETTFIVGVDTATRVLQPRFYDDSQEKMAEALAEIRERGCRFLVASRTDDDGVLHEAEEMNIPKAFSDLFTPIPADRFRHDVSSTQLRAQGTYWGPAPDYNVL